MRKKVFIGSPFCGNMEGNARKAAAYSRMACEEGHLPIAPHLLFPQFLNEGGGGRGREAARHLYGDGAAADL